MRTRFSATIESLDSVALGAFDPLSVELRAYIMSLGNGSMVIKGTGQHLALVS